MNVGGMFRIVKLDAIVPPLLQASEADETSRLAAVSGHRVGVLTEASDGERETVAGRGERAHVREIETQ